MREDHAEQVIEELGKVIRLDIHTWRRIRKRLIALNLKRGKQGNARVIDLKDEWIREARDWARDHIARNGSATIVDVTHHCPIPTGYPKSIAGAVFSHPDFKRIDTALVRERGRSDREIGVYALTEQQGEWDWQLDDERHPTPVLPLEIAEDDEGIVF